jgi:hypothetical protein
VTAAERAHRFVELWYTDDSTDELRELVAESYVHHAPIPAAG